jgi:hypothetical protein
MEAHESVAVVRRNDEKKDSRDERDIRDGRSCRAAESLTGRRRRRRRGRILRAAAVSRRRIRRGRGIAASGCARITAGWRSLRLAAIDRLIARGRSTILRRLRRSGRRNVLRRRWKRLQRLRWRWKRFQRLRWRSRGLLRRHLRRYRAPLAGPARTRFLSRSLGFGTWCLRIVDHSCVSLRDTGLSARASASALWQTSAL